MSREKDPRKNKTMPCEQTIVIDKSGSLLMKQITLTVIILKDEKLTSGRWLSLKIHPSPC